MTDHKHNHCKHTRLEYCAECQKPHCLDCKKEWNVTVYSPIQQYQWPYNSQPLYSYTTTNAIGSLQQKQNTATGSLLSTLCAHPEVVK